MQRSDMASNVSYDPQKPQLNNFVSEKDFKKSIQRNKNSKLQAPQNRKEFENAQSMNNKIMAVS